MLMQLSMWIPPQKVDWDDEGKFVAACIEPILYADDAATTQVMAVTRGVELANELGPHGIIIQSDWLQVIETL